MPRKPLDFLLDVIHHTVEAVKMGYTEASRQLLDLFSKYANLAGRNCNMAARALWHWIRGIAGEDKRLHRALLRELKQ